MTNTCIGRRAAKLTIARLLASPALVLIALLGAFWVTNPVAAAPIAIGFVKAGGPAHQAPGAVLQAKAKGFKRRGGVLGRGSHHRGLRHGRGRHGHGLHGHGLHGHRLHNRGFTRFGGFRGRGLKRFGTFHGRSTKRFGRGGNVLVKELTPGGRVVIKRFSHDGRILIIE